MRKIPLLVLVFILFGALDSAYAQGIWAGKDGNIKNVDARAMIIDRDELYLATKDGIYRSKDAREEWELIFSLSSGENEIRCLAGRSGNIFVGTRRGLYRSGDYGKTWRSVFKTIIPDKNNIVAIEVSIYYPGKILIGTEKGVFESRDSGDKWQEISGILKNRRVASIALNKDSAYACADDGLYFRKDNTSSWERIYVQSALEKTGTEEPSDPEAAEEDAGRTINCVALKNSRLYIGTDKKILYSDDGGKAWKNFPSDGLGGIINYIVVPKRSDKLYCATTKGVFEFMPDKARWLELYKGMNKVLNVSRIIFDGEEEKSLWALTGKGVYRLEGGRYIQDQYIDVEKGLKTLKIIFDGEPTFRELQQAALRFAEVSPDKITNWRREARMRALLPKVSFGLDNDSSTTAEIYTSATKEYVITGPDDISKGFDVSVSWELGDLIWSDDQTNIDVRSRLTTQLRNDILDDLRRAYYERKRLRFELIQSPPQDLKSRFERELRIQELTQAIDDLTGNYLSEHTRK